MTYAEALNHLAGLGPELANSKRRFDLAHMRRLAAALGSPQDRVPAVLIAGTNGKGSTAATLASICTAAGYRTGLYTSPHLSRVNERIQLARPTLPSEYGTTTPGTDGALTLSPIPDEDFARLYTAVDAAGTTLVESGDLPEPPSFFERLTALAFAYYAEQQADITILEVGLGGRLDATNIVSPLISVITDIALDHQEFLGNTIAEIATEKCGILRQHGTLITLPQLPEANHAIGLAATALGVHAINAAPYIPPPQRATDPPMQRNTGSTTEPGAPGLASESWDQTTVDLHDPSENRVPHSSQPHRDEWVSAQAARGPALSQSLHLNHDPEGPGFDRATLRPATNPATATEVRSPLPRNRYTVTLEDNTQLQIDSPLPGTHQQRNLALAITTAITLRNPNSYALQTIRNQESYNLSNSAIEAGFRDTVWPGRLEFLAPNLLLDVAHNPAGAWTLRSALAALDPNTPRTLIFSCLRDKSLSEMSRILFPLFDSSPDADPLRRHDHILLAPIASPRAAHVDDLLTAAHALSIPAHAAPHLAAALSQARQITPPGGLIVATGSVYLVGEIRELIFTEKRT